MSLHIYNPTTTTTTTPPYIYIVSVLVDLPHIWVVYLAKILGVQRTKNPPPPPVHVEVPLAASRLEIVEVELVLVGKVPMVLPALLTRQIKKKMMMHKKKKGKYMSREEVGLVVIGQVLAMVVHGAWMRKMPTRKENELLHQAVVGEAKGPHPRVEARRVVVSFNWGRTCLQMEMKKKQMVLIWCLSHWVTPLMDCVVWILPLHSVRLWFYIDQRIHLFSDLGYFKW
jgi:hypothetical protein